TPTGEIVATPLRGAWTGNRGVLHEGREIVRFHGGNLWITCAREFRGTPRRPFHEGPWADLPDGAFVLDAGAPWLVLGNELVAWSPFGYGERRRRPNRGTATAITPPATLAVLRA